MPEKAYFQKFVLSTRVKLSNGNTPPWVGVGNNVGVLETADELTKAELTAFAERGVGGVKVIDKATHDDLKKNSEPKLPKPVWAPRVTPVNLDPLKSPKAKSGSSSKSTDAAETKPAAPIKTEAPATATGVFPPDTSIS